MEDRRNEKDARRNVDEGGLGRSSVRGGDAFILLVISGIQASKDSQLLSSLTFRSLNTSSHSCEKTLSHLVAFECLLVRFGDKVQGLTQDEPTLRVVSSRLDVDRFPL